MKKRTVYLTGVFLLLGLFIFTACDSFYTNSWGKSREYDPGNIKLTVENLPSWKKAARYNPPLAQTLTAVINETVRNMPDGPGKAIFQEAGVELAIKSAGLGTAILSNMNKFNLDNPDDIVALFGSIRGDFYISGGSAAASNLAEIVKPKGGFDKDDGDTPTFSSSYANIAKPADVGQAVIVLTLAVLEQTGESTAILDDPNFDIDAFSIGLKMDGNVIKVDSPPDPTPEALALAAYLNLINNGDPKFDSNPVTSGIKDLFSL